MNNFSEYIVYIDESGDHSLKSIDKDYPVFVLALTIFNKKEYAENIVPNYQDFKFRHFGHDIIVLHENEIRRRKNQFKFLFNKTLETNFIVELSQIIDNSNFQVITCVINKNKLNTSSTKDKNPYHIASEFCLNSLDQFLSEQN